MKKIWFILSLMTFAIQAMTQEKPQKVVSIVDEEHEKSWYETQAKLWNAELKKNPKNENGWLYYYTAKRMVCHYEDWSKERTKELETLLVEMQKAIPKSFTYYYLQGRNLGCWEPKGLEYLIKAYEIQPENPETFDELVVHFETSQDLNKRKEFNQKWFSSGTYSPGKLAYNYNVLASLSQNAIIFTGGDNDTYPIWMLQDVLNYRTDVVLINMSLIKINEYRQKVFQKLGIKLDADEEKNFGKTDSEEESTNYLKNLLKTLISKLKDRNLYFALTLSDHAYRKDLESKLYIVGLASIYSEEKIDNNALLRTNFEKNYKLDYLKVRLYNEPAKTITLRFDQSYITPLIMLYNHYTKSSDIEKAENAKSLLLKIAKENNIEKDVLPLLK